MEASTFFMALSSIAVAFVLRALCRSLRQIVIWLYETTEFTTSPIGWALGVHLLRTGSPAPGLCALCSGHVSGVCILLLFLILCLGVALFDFILVLMHLSLHPNVLWQI